MNMRKSSFLVVFLLMSVALFSQQTQTSQKTFRISKNLSIFNSVFRELDAYYVDTLNYDNMMKTAIDNMLAKLDPYTVYMPEEETDDLTFMTTGEYAGIGALIMKDENDVYVSEPYEGLPAQKNDVRAGDVIVEVDGKPTKGLSVSQVSALLKGTPGTEIHLKLKRYGEKNLVERKFLRQKIQMNPVAYYGVVAPGVGYVMLSDFTDKSALEVKNAISELVKNDNIKSLIIDLRNNGGGLVDEAVKIVGYFVPKGTEVVNTKGKTSLADHVYKTPVEPLFPDLNLAVLVNRSSASASEILTGSLQDMDKAVVVGERTFGKGLVQNIRPIGYGGHLKVTTAKYYIPSGRCIQAIDYSHRNEDGSVGRVPDSLTSEFKTKHGRIVRDGGGIVPDIKTTDNKKVNIAYYIYAQNQYFKYANKFVSEHPTIAKPEDFKLTDKDYNDFVNYLTDIKFTYTPQTSKYLDQLLDVAKSEGLDDTAKAEFDALKAKLMPDIQKSLYDNKDDIADFLTLEILKRYYFQKGDIIYSLKTDEDLKSALNVLSDHDKYLKTLGLE